MKSEIIIMNILAQLVLIENKNYSYTPGSGQTFILAHIDITIIFFLFIKVRSRKPLTKWSITLDVGTMTCCYCSI